MTSEALKLRSLNPPHALDFAVAWVLSFASLLYSTSNRLCGGYWIKQFLDRTIEATLYAVTCWREVGLRCCITDEYYLALIASHPASLSSRTVANRSRRIQAAILD